MAIAALDIINAGGRDKTLSTVVDCLQASFEEKPNSTWQNRSLETHCELWSGGERYDDKNEMMIFSQTIR